MLHKPLAFSFLCELNRDCRLFCPVHHTMITRQTPRIHGTKKPITLLGSVGFDIEKVVRKVGGSQVITSVILSSLADNSTRHRESTSPQIPGCVHRSSNHTSRQPFPEVS